MAASLAISAMPMPVGAQQSAQPPANQQPVQQHPPRLPGQGTPGQLEKLEEDLPASPGPGVDRPRSVVTEKRAYGGRVTEIEVQSGGSRYYLQPNYPGSAALPGELDSNRIRAPQWSIKQFDLKRSDDSRKNNDPTAGTPPPPTGPSAPPR